MEGSAAESVALRPQAAAERLDNAAGDVQPQSGALRRRVSTSTGFADAHARLEDVLQLLGRDTSPLVMHR